MKKFFILCFLTGASVNAWGGRASLPLRTSLPKLQSHLGRIGVDLNIERLMVTAATEFEACLKTKKGAELVTCIKTAKRKVPQAIFKAVYPSSTREICVGKK